MKVTMVNKLPFCVDVEIPDVRLFSTETNGVVFAVKVLDEMFPTIHEGASVLFSVNDDEDYVPQYGTIISALVSIPGMVTNTCDTSHKPGRVLREQSAGEFQHGKHEETEGPSQLRLVVSRFESNIIGVRDGHYVADGIGLDVRFVCDNLKYRRLSLSTGCDLLWRILGTYISHR